jgi:hypothetical protein
LYLEEWEGEEDPRDSRITTQEILLLLSVPRKRS